MTISGWSASARALRQPVCQREPTDLSTRAADEAKLRIFMISGLWSPAFVPGLALALAFFDDLIYNHRVDKTGLMTTGLTTTGSTNRPIGGDRAAQGHLCATDAAEPALSTATATETAALEPSVYPNTDPGVAPNVDPSADSWRVEVAHRLERYRTRRKPRTPRYPSLLLPFDAPQSRSRPATESGSAAVAASSPDQDFAFPTKEEPATVETPSFTEPRQPSSRHTSEQAPELSANVIEFPRSAAIPVFHPSDLADPVFDRHRPRIVEVPEILPPPPALGGMLIEPAHLESADRRAATDSPIASTSPSASIGRRTLAFLVDGIVLTIALGAFVAIVLRLNPTLIQGLNPSLISFHGPLPILA